MAVSENKPANTSQIFILASASPRRKALLEQISFPPDRIIAADIDESVRAGELAPRYAIRLATEKAKKVAKDHPNDLVLAADTVVACGRRILPKAEDEEVARQCLKLLSGRAHRVYSGVALAGPDDGICLRTVETRLKVRRLSPQNIDEYIASGEWRGKAGGYAIQGLFAKHVISLIGSYTNVVGLPLYETANLLDGAGRPRS
ncbi:MAG: Maf family protein [Pseudomonadota bacterium]